MYVNEILLYMALEDNGLEEFPSETHHQICKHLLLGNPNITTRDGLRESAKRVLSLSEEATELTWAEAEKLVCI